VAMADSTPTRNTCVDGFSDLLPQVHVLSNEIFYDDYGGGDDNLFDYEDQNVIDEASKSMSRHPMRKDGRSRNLQS